MYSEKNKNSLNSPISKKIISFVYNTGIIRTGRQLWSKSLTVLNYHRIDDPNRDGFDSFSPNVSAHPNEFNSQMDYLSRWFNVVSLRDIVNWFDGKQTLPPYAALITFDDGYLDNYTNAYPILQKYNFPAVIYLSTGHIDTDEPFYWDLAAYCFFHTTKDRILFPDNVEHTWKTKNELHKTSKNWIEALKILPDTQKQDLIFRLPEQLGVTIPQNYFRKLMMNWDQVREMYKNGIDFGGHTRNHPILSRISLEQAKTEIEGSKNDIEKELGEPVLSFAYPNGKSPDLNIDIKNLVSQAGYRVAFTLMNGPTSLQEARRNPYAIRRIFIGNNHTLPKFATLMHPFNRYRP